MARTSDSDSGFVSVLKRTPFLNFFAFSFIHGVPDPQDLMYIYNTIALVSALLMAMLGGLLTFTNFEDAQKLTARFR